MATLLLQAAGAYIGSYFGAVGSTIAAAAGAYGGYLIDQSLINSTRRIQGQRLSSPQSLTGEEGAPLPRVYGTTRQGGTLIWATRFEEASKTSRQGSKASGPKVTTFSYYANFAVAICEGEIAHVRRIWADGKELDLTENSVRIYKGSLDQLPDPLIEAKQGTGNAPAYRGTAYAVFDGLALSNFGNRIPQMQFEVIRITGGMAKDIQAITVIPGSTEFGLSPTAISQTIQAGETRLANRHVLYAGSDWEASIDELQALCPNLKSVALVVAWFGNDLRAGNCLIQPGVTTASGYQNDNWRVSNQKRANAYVVSSYNGSAAFGGTPDDASVVAAIADLKSRGLKVTLYPFVLMDIPEGNSLPSPYGGNGQANYPWRGEISCDPAPGVAGSVDGTAVAANQIAGFVGNALPSSFEIVSGRVSYAGASDWGYRRFILHYAKLAALAGGVNAFLIGSEFKALTRVRGTAGYPFVGALSTLASDVRAILGSNAKLTYGADWSEYGAYTPPGTNHLHFNLDPLWANPAINAVGIDNYMPLSDWRDEDWDGNNPDGASSPSDGRALSAAISAGEGYDWYYANTTNRQRRIRSPIQDGGAGKPWVYRFKDIQSWWQNAHYERTNGIEETTPTAWAPQSKPIWFTELGCPAIDKAANQPNVFPDAKSSSAAIPYYSNGGRDDEAQARFLAAHFEHWARPSQNPISDQYAGHMLDIENSYIWAWDARPFPAFPLAGNVWGDGTNWLTGHWLNGRITGVSLKEIVQTVFLEHGLQNIDVSELDGVLGGYVTGRPSSIRETLDALLALYRVDVTEQGGILKFRSRERALPVSKLIKGLALNASDMEAIEVFNASSDAPTELSLEFRDLLRDHQSVSVTSNIHQDANSEETIAIPATLDAGEAKAQLRQFHRQQTNARGTISFETGFADIALQTGDLVSLTFGGTSYRVLKIEDTQRRRFEAEIALAPTPLVRRSTLPTIAEAQAVVSGPPLSVFMDLPLLPNGATSIGGLRLAVWSNPWSPNVALASPSADAYSPKVTLNELAILGLLATALYPGNAGRIATNDTIDVNLSQGSLVSISDVLLLNGGNACAIANTLGDWEVLQFRTATELSAGRWRLSGLLRGQAGTQDAMLFGAPIGARFVLLDTAVKACNLSENETDIALNWKVGPASKSVSNRYFDTQTIGPALRSKKANAPVHLKQMWQENGDIAFNWIRTGALNADSWEAADIPLLEPSEAYSLTISGADKVIKRQTTVVQNQWTYTGAQRLADFGTGINAINLEVSQISANGLAGLPKQIGITF